MNSELTRKILLFFFIASIATMLWSHYSGYSNSIDWEVTTTAEVIQFPAWSLTTDLMTHEILGENYLLSEQYTGTKIQQNILSHQILPCLMWIGLCFVLASATYLKRYGFFISVAVFALFLNRLNLFEVSLFSIQSKWIILIPFLLFATPLIVFHEYKKSVPFAARFFVLLVISVAIWLGFDNTALFTEHFIAHSLFGFAICALLFLFIVSEEIIFGILYIVTSSKGGKSNHLHFLILSLVYLSNITLYYLNKSGIYKNSFFFFDPFVLLTISCVVSIWTLRYKANHVGKYIDARCFYFISFSLGIISILFLAQQMIAGNDGVYEAFHYFILYTHIGFGGMFILYLIGNFIDPLAKGFEVYKIAYKERNFPYLSARLGGFIAALAFYFVAVQEPYNLLRSGYYNHMASEAKMEGNPLLANEYTLYASHVGYNTHYANYTLGWNELDKGSKYTAKNHFYHAAQRFPSPYAWVNYGNLEAEMNPSKVQAIYEEVLRKESHNEIANNLGLLYSQKTEYQKALDYFDQTNTSQEWNNAPLLNKWEVLHKLNAIDSLALTSDYQEGNYGVKSNILCHKPSHTSLSFEVNNLQISAPLHRQAYLLNSSYFFEDDTLEVLVRQEIEQPAIASYTNQLRKALAIHLYKKGEVNKAFMMLDYLQAHANPVLKGVYLDALGKFAMDQQAYQLSLEFFNKALEANYPLATFSKLEVLARMGNTDQIPQELIGFLKKRPELTKEANIILDRLASFTPPRKQSHAIVSLESLSDEEIIQIGSMNAFNEDQVVEAATELTKRNASGGYELLIDATEINPYGTKLLKTYALTAIDWNLTTYADQTLTRLQELLPTSEFNEFMSVYEQKKQQLSETSW